MPWVPEPGASSCRGAARPVRWGKRFTGRAVHHRPAAQRAFVVCGRPVSPDEGHADQLPDVRTLRRDVLLVGHHRPTLRLSYASSMPGTGHRRYLTTGERAAARTARLVSSTGQRGPAWAFADAPVSQ